MYIYKCIHTAPYNTIALGLGHTITEIEPDGFNSYIAEEALGEILDAMNMDCE
jgi:hypothetical protein